MSAAYSPDLFPNLQPCSHSRVGSVTNGALAFERCLDCGETLDVREVAPNAETIRQAERRGDLVPSCELCQRWGYRGVAGPAHRPRCGARPHCSCDRCF